MRFGIVDKYEDFAMSDEEVHVREGDEEDVGDQGEAVQESKSSLQEVPLGSGEALPCAALVWIRLGLLLAWLGLTCTALLYLPLPFVTVLCLACLALHCLAMVLLCTRVPGIKCSVWEHSRCGSNDWHIFP